MTLNNKTAKYRKQRMRLATDLNLGDLEQPRKSKTELREMLATAVRNRAKQQEEEKKP